MKTNIVMTRGTMVDGKVRKAGETVEVEDRVAQFIVGLGKAKFTEVEAEEPEVKPEEPEVEAKKSAATKAAKG